MSSVTLLTNLFIRIFPEKMPAKEKVLLELLLFASLCKELMIFYGSERNNLEMEQVMMSGCGSVLQGIVSDLLNNNDYTLLGLASYTGYPEEVIYDLALGKNLNPTISLSAKIIELHMTARRDFYNQIIGKLFSKLEDGKSKYC